ncbi:UNVERIFIED_CONTAM: hypothetical protein Sradi_5407900 [Sesamum radiatum]|uniref:Uncharacterized protein n=1 Tax=Sesamum radiatum TaxID=300843 RepID=A0AAW2L9K3_SESRA
MIEGSSVREHGVMKLSLMEKLKDFQANFEKEETYVGLILQSLPLSFEQFIVYYNMNGLEKSLHELINMLVQYEITIEKSVPSVLVGEISTSKANGKLLNGGKEKRKRIPQSRIPNNICIYCQEKGHWKWSVLSYSPMKVKKSLIEY